MLATDNLPVESGKFSFFPRSNFKMSLHIGDTLKPKISVEDWLRNQRQRVQEYNELSELGFGTRQKSAELRDVSAIETQLNQKLTNDLLAERYKEIVEWKDLIEECVRDVKNEMQRLNYEKELCSRDLQNLNPKFTLVNECITLRSGRVKTDLCLDPVDAELEKEHRLLESLKLDLSEKCEEAFKRCTTATELLNLLLIDVEQKQEACSIEKSTLDIYEKAVNVCHKPEMTRFINYSSYRSWLENCKYLQSQTVAELQKCIQLREEMNRCRQLAFNQRLAQFDATNFAFRKRIFETRLFLDELKWQKQMLNQEEERMSDEIHKLKEKLNQANEALKLFESQNRNRIYRVNVELCNEKCTENLEIQVLQAKQRVEHLGNQLNLAMKAYNLLDQQIQRLEEDIKTKTCSVVIDSRCMEIRNEAAEFSC